MANILKKVKAGKPLTKSELDQVAGRQNEKEVGERKRFTRDQVRERAQFWCARLRSMQQYIQDGVPVHDPAGMWRWYTAMSARSQGMLAPDLRRRIYEEHAKLSGDSPGINATDPDVAEFDRTYKPDAADAKGNMANLKRQCAYYLFKTERARVARDRASEGEAAKQFLAFSDLVHDAELRALKLGRDLGESFSAADVDRLGRSMAFWLMHSADQLITQITSALMTAMAAGPLDRETVRKAIDPLVLDARVLAPLVRAAQVNAPIALPARFVEAIKEGLASVAEDGAGEFDRLYATPPTR